MHDHTATHVVTKTKHSHIDWAPLPVWLVCELPEFYAVKSEPRSSCSSLRDKDVLFAAMRSELAYKREGMLEILDDEARFRQAQNHYNDLNMVFEAVSAACQQAL